MDSAHFRLQLAWSQIQLHGLLNDLDDSATQRLIQPAFLQGVEKIYHLIKDQKPFDARFELGRWWRRWEKILGEEGVPTQWARYAEALRCECILISNPSRGITAARNILDEHEEDSMEYDGPDTSHDRLVLHYLQAVTRGEAACVLAPPSLDEVLRSPKFH